jgi:Flp pilus assembly protein TadG
MRSAALDKWLVRHDLGKAGAEQGQALVEFTLMVPLLFLLIVNAVNFGGWLYSWVAVGNAARAGADYAAMGAASVDFPIEPTAANVVSMVQTETSSLPNWTTSNPTITACQRYNGATTLLNSTSACPVGVTTLPDDPEGLAYTLLAVDVTYTYSPFIPLFQFPSLGIYATIPPTPIHRRAVMRVLN